MYSMWLSLLQFYDIDICVTFDGEIPIIWNISWRLAKHFIWQYQEIFPCFKSECIDHQMPSLLEKNSVEYCVISSPIPGRQQERRQG